MTKRLPETNCIMKEGSIGSWFPWRTVLSPGMIE